VVGERNLKNGQLEIKSRETGKKELVVMADALEHIRRTINQT
jgi:hypothetical protein